jgi:hypothetical protein
VSWNRHCGAWRWLQWWGNVALRTLVITLEPPVHRNLQKGRNRSLLKSSELLLGLQWQEN